VSAANDEQVKICEVIDRLYAAGWKIALRADDPLPGLDRLWATHETSGRKLETVVTGGGELLVALESLVTGNMALRHDRG